MHTTGFVALSCIGFIASAPAMAQDTDDPKRLEGVVVTGVRDQESYRAEATDDAKTTAALVDTPRTVNVITEAVLRDTASFSLQDALRTVPGITLSAGEGGTASGDIPLIRGVDATGDTFVDGARDVGSQTREIFAVERVEVFKGPNSAFGGRGAAGGAINIVSKLPTNRSFASAQATIGTDDLYRVTGDANIVVADRLAVRVAAMVHDADVPGRDAVYDRRWGVAPSIAWGVGTGSTASVAYYHLETEALPDYGIPLTSPGQLTGGVRAPADVDYDSFYGLPVRDFQETSSDAVTFKFDGDLGGGWTLSPTLRWSRTRNNYIVTNPDDSAGNVANGLVWRNTKSRDSVNQSLVGVVTLSGIFATGPIDHSLATGIEFTRSDTRNIPYTVATDPRTCDAAQLASYNCTTIDAPNPSDPWTGAITRGAPSTASVDDLSVYAFDTITIIPQLLVNAGIRYTTYDARGAGTTRGVPFASSNEADFVTYQGGVVFKPTETTSLYVSYADSANPPGSDVGEGANNIAATNGNFDPQTTENWEAGAKAELFGGDLLVTGAVFQVDRGNIQDNDPLAGPITIASRARLRGFEVGASGRAGPVQLTAGYTLVDSEIRDGSALDGNALPNTPRHNLAVTASIDATRRLTIGGGVYGASERYADTANLIRADGYARVDLTAAYRLTDRLSVRANLQNAFDNRYVVKLRNPHFAVPSQGRQGLVTVAFQY